MKKQLKVLLPLTLAIIRGLLVEIRDRVYAIPLTSVAEVLRISRANVRSVARRPAIDSHELAKYIVVADLEIR